MAANPTSSKPVTAMSPGTRSPASSIAAIAPIAIASLAQAIASGGSGRSQQPLGRLASRCAGRSRPARRIRVRAGKPEPVSSASDSRTAGRPGAGVLVAGDVSDPPAPELVEVMDDLRHRFDVGRHHAARPSPDQVVVDEDDGSPESRIGLHLRVVCSPIPQTTSASTPRSIVCSAAAARADHRGRPGGCAEQKIAVSQRGGRGYRSDSSRRPGDGNRGPEAGRDERDQEAIRGPARATTLSDHRLGARPRDRRAALLGLLQEGRVNASEAESR